MDAVGGWGAAFMNKRFSDSPRHQKQANRLLLQLLLLPPNLLCCWPCRVQIISSKCTATPTQLSRGRNAEAKAVQVGVVALKKRLQRQNACKISKANARLQFTCHLSAALDSCVCQWHLQRATT